LFQKLQNFHVSKIIPKYTGFVAPSDIFCEKNRQNLVLRGSKLEHNPSLSPTSHSLSPYEGLFFVSDIGHTKCHRNK
jgi:hypothetical protein